MTRDEWTHRVCADFGRVLAEMDAKPLSAGEAKRLAEGGAQWLLENPSEEHRTLGEAMGLAALLLIMVRETCIENEQKRAEEKAS